MNQSLNVSNATIITATSIWWLNLIFLRSKIPTQAMMIFINESEKSAGFVYKQCTLICAFSFGSPSTAAYFEYDLFFTSYYLPCQKWSNDLFARMITNKNKRICLGIYHAICCRQCCHIHSCSEENVSYMFPIEEIFLSFFSKSSEFDWRN